MFSHLSKIVVKWDRSTEITSGISSPISIYWRGAQRTVGSTLPCPGCHDYKILSWYTRGCPHVAARFRVCSPNDGKSWDQVPFCPHSQCFESHFDVIFLMYLVFLSSQPHPHQSSWSTQFSQEWVCTNIQSNQIKLMSWRTFWRISDVFLNFLTSWQTFLTSWQTFWSPDVFLPNPTKLPPPIPTSSSTATSTPSNQTHYSQYPTKPTPTLPYPARPYPTLPYPTLPYPTLPYPTLPYPTLPYPTLPYPTLPYPTLPYPTLPYPTLPYPTLPYPLPYLHFQSPPPLALYILRRQKVHHDVKRFVLMSKRLSYTYKKYIMTSKSLSWRHKVCHDVKIFGMM